MKCVWLWAALGAASLLGCGDPLSAQTTQLTLDRPVDVAFACFGDMRVTGGRAPGDPADKIERTAQPTSACEELSPPLAPPMDMPIVRKFGQETINGLSITPSWYTFILQSASGTVAVATSTPRPADAMMGGFSDFGGDYDVLDTDPLTPGKNAISIGEDPVAIATDKAGCFEITANAGSCDLSALEINSALDDVLPIPGKAVTPVRIDRVQVTNAMGTAILAKPAAMVAEPGATIVGNMCPTAPSGRTTATGLVYVAYPGCHLVAGIDVATGRIMTGIAFAVDGTPSILSGAALDGVTCPAECTSAAGGAASGSITPGLRPVALDLRQDTRVSTSRLAIGADNSNSLTIVELDPANSTPVSVSQVALEDPTGKLGVTAVAMSPQIGMGGNAEDGPVSDATSPAGQGQYVYAVATDGTVRVADVLNLRRECDTQIDGRFLRGASATELPCLAAGDPMRPRRSGARGPGIELPDRAVPTSVAIVKGRTAPPVNTTTQEPLPPAPTTLLGYFAIVTASSGQTYVVNVDDDHAPDVFTSGDPLGTAPVLVMAHQLRDSFFSRDQGPQTVADTKACAADNPPAAAGGALAGGPRIPDGPAQIAPTGTITPANLLALPTIRQVACTLDNEANPVPVSELEFGADRDDVRDQVYPDLRSVASETWTLTWEGTLSLDNVTTSVDGPTIRTGQIVVDSRGMRITDPAQPFCDVGVEPFDLVDLRGCNPANGDADCPSGYTCFVHPQSVGVGVGACMLASEAPRLADACFPFLTTLRRYTVGKSVVAGELVLLERKHELATTPIDGCVDDNQCDQLAQDAAKIDASADPFTSRTHWTCQTDPLRAPISADPARNKRCIQACSTDPAHPWDCANGSICRPLAPGSTEGICLEGVQPPPECVRGPQRYDVRASKAFTVIGSQSGYVHPFIKQPGGVACVRDPAAQPVQIGRIPIDPLNVPACLAADAVDPITGQVKGQPGVFEPNPCSLMVMQFDNHPQVDPTQPNTILACAADPIPPPPAPQPPLQMRSAQAIKFRNRAMTMTLVDPYQACLPNNQGSVSNVSLLTRGYQLEFAQRAGFLALQLPAVGPAYPVKVVRGPSESIWVIDAGDALGSVFGEEPTRGRVYRIESVDVGIVNQLR